MRRTSEGRRIAEGYAASGMTRRAYCERHGIRISTLDYWRRQGTKKPRLVEVAMEPAPAGGGFTLVLLNGRRIESSWRFSEADLARLIRAAGA
jgi:hypothetical protein